MFGRVPVSIWNPASKFRLLSRSAQGMYLFLYTSPDLSPLGVLWLRPGRWAAAASGLTREDVESDLAELDHEGYIMADLGTDELLVRWFMRDSLVYTNNNLMKTVPDLMAQVESPLIRRALAEELSALNIAARQTGNAYAPSLFDDADSEGGSTGATGDSLPRPSERVPSTSTSTSTSTSSPSKNQRARVRRSFDAFWAVYPRKVGKLAAQAKWESKVVQPGVDPAVVIAAAEQLAARPGRESKFTPHPTTWLNQGRWEDQDDDGPGDSMSTYAFD